MNLLILEPPYSPLFRDLTAYLRPTNTYAHIFNVGNIVYLWGAKFLLMSKMLYEKKPDQGTINTVRSIKSLANSNVVKPSEQDLLTMARYYDYLKNFISQNKITHIFCHNDLRWQHAIAKVVAAEMHVKIFFTEEGLFRPDTMTLDDHGVNANSSVPRNRDHYNRDFLPTPDFKHIQASYFRRSIRLLRFVMFLIINKMGDLLGLNVKPKNKQYVFDGYVKLFWKKLGKKTRPVLEEKPAFEYIFVPLQVTNDTQTVVHSPFSGTQEFINKTQKSYDSLPAEIRSKYKLVYKKHPMEDHIEYSFSPSCIVSKAATPDLVKGSALVVLINSTVIVDALKSGKPVITLGESFFNIEGLTYRSKVSTLTEDIVRCLTDNVKPDGDLLDNFLSYLKYYYQINGNIFYYDHGTIQSVAKRIELAKS